LFKVSGTRIGAQVPRHPKKHIKHSEKICSVCGGHLISMNFPLRNCEGDYVYSSRAGGREPAPTSIPMKDEWYVVRKQFFIGFQFPH
jgi:hypothetical protein